MTPDATQHALKQLSLGLGLLGFGCGFLLSYGVLAGDAEGRVNLLFVLLLFAFVPVVGLMLSLLFVVRGGGKGFAGWLLDLPLWPKHLTLTLPRLTIFHGRKMWFFYQTQVFSLSFGCGCILLYLLLLLGSDISFVWRSTLLEPKDLLPALQVISMPWSFWHEAQASLALIEQTRDFRLDPQGSGYPLVGLWWKYLLAAQIVYNLLPRSLMLLFARQQYRKYLASDIAATEEAGRNRHQASSLKPGELANIVTSVNTPYTLLDWAGVPSGCIAQLGQIYGETTAVYPIGPIVLAAESRAAKNQSQVVLVKSWEPPLAELADRLSGIDSNSDKLILPLDWDEQGIRQPTIAHLKEWQRFTATLAGWQLLGFKEST